jgi:hypothetical protein
MLLMTNSPMREETFEHETLGTVTWTPDLPVGCQPSLMQVVADKECSECDMKNDCRECPLYEQSLLASIIGE